jgi:hypothetical protein
MRSRQKMEQVDPEKWMKREIPRLISFYFGEKTKGAEGRSTRLKKWSQLFEQWSDDSAPPGGYAQHAMLA